MTHETNWAGNYAYRAARIHYPESVDELREIVARAPKIHALGSRHGFNAIADSAELVSIDAIDPSMVIDRETTTVSVGAGIRYGTLAQALHAEGLALHNMASLPHITVAGAIATATHGSGDRHGNLATAVSGLEIVTSDGDLLYVGRGDEDFSGMVVGIGALCVVTRVTLDVQPTFLVRQEVFENLSWDAYFEHFDAITSSAYSVSLFTKWDETADVLWLKHRIDPEQALSPESNSWGASPAGGDRHPLAELSGEGCTAQMGIAGPWCDRLPHFRMDATPASGEEIQSEYMVARKYAIPAMEAMRGLAHQFRSLLLTTEIRTVAADDLWMSTAYGTDTVCIHFSWKRDQEGVDRLLPIVEAALEPFQPRPHWSKTFAATATDLELRYERMADFRALAQRLDSRGAFRNEFLERTIWGG